jgi:ABC-2 type transport system permease protein
MRKFLKYELDRYLRGRSSEILEEMPLMRAENQAYIHYRKGSVIMMALRDRLGEKRLNASLNRLMERFRYQTDPYPTTLDLVAALGAEANEQERQFLASLFEEITLYDLKAKSVEAQSLDSGKTKVTFTVDAKRFTADGKGVETEGELSEYIDVVIFNADPEDLTAENTVLYQNKHLIQTGQNVIEIEVEGEPKYAGIDPFVKLVDRDSADNVIKF